MTELTIPSGPLVSTEWLAEHLNHPAVRVIDMRGRVLPPTDPKPHYFARPEDYAAGHIPNALYVNWIEDIIDPAQGALKQVATSAQIEALCARLGIGPETLVVAYDDAFGMFAGRLMWVLRYHGHELVRVLDGGLVKWQAEGRPLSTEVPTFAPAAFVSRPQPQLRRTADEVLANISAAEFLLLDARSPREYAGEESRAVRGGHIPGATNIFYRDLVSGPDQTYASPEQLRERFAAAGVPLDGPEVVAYCNGGVSATPVAIAFELATGRKAGIYDGSWNEWGNDESKPLERA